jgi:hypothetical protein
VRAGPGGRGCAKGNRVIASADIVMIVLRFFHIVGGALWVGSAFLFVAVIGPSAAEVGPSAGPLLQVAVKKRKVATQITIFATATVVAGWLMWLKDLRDYDWNVSDWVFHSGGFGLAITLGAIMATIAYYEGYFHVGKGVEELVDLGAEMAAAEGPPPPEKLARMQSIQESLKKHGQVDIVLLLLTVALMATARYW